MNAKCPPESALRFSTGKRLGKICRSTKRLIDCCILSSAKGRSSHGSPRSIILSISWLNLGSSPRRTLTLFYRSFRRGMITKDFSIFGKNVMKIDQIIAVIDNHLERSGKDTLGAVEANKILEQSGKLNDREPRPGRPLRVLLREGLIPHAYQVDGKGSRWIIPHSGSRHTPSKRNTI